MVWVVSVVTRSTLEAGLQHDSVKSSYYTHGSTTIEWCSFSEKSDDVLSVSTYLVKYYISGVSKFVFQSKYSIGLLELI